MIITLCNIDQKFRFALIAAKSGNLFLTESIDTNKFGIWCDKYQKGCRDVCDRYNHI